MAIGIENTDNTDLPDSDYPYGKVRDNPGDGSGTPANTKTLGDFHQFFARLLDKAGIVANGLPDNDYSGFQYFEALLELMGGKTKIIEIGDWDMDADSTKIVPHGIADYTKIRSVRGVFKNDADTVLITIPYVSNTLNDMVGVNSITASDINLIRTNAGQFDSTNYNSTGFNRGFLIIQYID